ncbi:MAG TPA: FAD-dependent oxidoreductase, partial [Coleofasciculaceae cyanobacterium]
LATNLEIWLNRRVQSITPTTEATWHLTIDSTAEPPKALTAKAVVVAIPAPQAWMLLEPLALTTLSPTFVERLCSVEFDPCISVMAGYSEKSVNKPIWKACTLSNNPDLAWIGLDSSKRPNSKMPVFVLQSTAEFANRYLETQDFNLAGQELLSHAAQILIPGLDTPDWFQVHRWRYAFPKSPLNQDCLNAELSMPLICCGDWCGGNRIESAMNSGLAAAVEINQKMQQRILPGTDFLAVL